MGWFLRTKKTNARTLKFSSPLGGGLVRKQNSADLGYFNTFSSPSGDGLVLQILTEILKNQVIRYRHNKQLQTDR